MGAVLELHQTVLGQELYSKKFAFLAFLTQNLFDLKFMQHSKVYYFVNVVIEVLYEMGDQFST